MRSALIVGHRGQDGVLLSDLLRLRGYLVVGLDRSELLTPSGSSIRPPRVDDGAEVADLFKKFAFGEVYYLAAYHGSSQAVAGNTAIMEYCRSHSVHVVGLLNVLEAVRVYSPGARVFYAASSLLFGSKIEGLQDEETSLSPVGIYGVTKAEGMMLCRDYRTRYGLYTAVGILYNHESHLRSPSYVSRKIIDCALRISRGSTEKLEIALPEAEVDWSHAIDFVEAFCSILQLQYPEDFVIASGVSHTVREFVDVAFSAVGIDTSNKIISGSLPLTRSYSRRIGNPAKLLKKTGVSPRYTFRTMIESIVATLRTQENS